MRYVLRLALVFACALPFQEAAAQVLVADTVALDATVRRYSQRAEAFGTATDARVAVWEARLYGLRREYGFSVQGQGSFYPTGGPTISDETEQVVSGSLTLEWELLRNGYLQAKWERERLQQQIEIVEEQGLRQSVAEELAFRQEIVEMGRLTVLHSGYEEAIVFTEEVLDNLESLYETRDVLRSDVLAVQERLDRYRYLQARYAQQARLQARLLQTALNDVPEMLAVTLPDSLPPVLDVEVLLQAAEERVAEIAELAVLDRRIPTVVDGAASEARFNLFAGLEARQYDGVLSEDIAEVFDERQGRMAFVVGARAALPFSFFATRRAAERERAALEQLAVYTAEGEVEQALRSLTNALAEYERLIVDLATLQAELPRRTAEMREADVTLDDAIRETRLTPNEAALQRAENAVTAARLDALRYELWAQHYRLLSLAGLPPSAAPIIPEARYETVLPAAEDNSGRPDLFFDRDRR